MLRQLIAGAVRVALGVVCSLSVEHLLIGPSSRPPSALDDSSAAAAGIAGLHREDSVATMSGEGA